ncbi:hypothetical protein F132_26 [Flavobacterium sp. phage 1/32]|nr:hypothetical protein F132_26 [Flavobacterium sp. phage 1/32]
MKKIICLLTVLLMCTVSYGLTTDVTAKKSETKVLVIGMDNDFVAVVKAFAQMEKTLIVFEGNVKEVKTNLEQLKPFILFVPYEDNFYKEITLTDRIHYENYREVNKFNLKNKNKNYRIHKTPFRSPRDAI